MKKNSILKNYCVLYCVNTGFEIDEEFLWRNRPNTSFLSLDEEKVESNSVDMYINAETVSTGIIQAYTITEAKIKMMKWIENYRNNHGFASILSNDEENWLGFCNFNKLMQGYDLEEIIEEFKEYFQLSSIELLKDIIGEFFNMFYSEHKQYQTIHDFVFEKNQDSPIVRKWRLFNDDEINFFRLFNNRQNFELFYVENILKI